MGCIICGWLFFKVVIVSLYVCHAFAGFLESFFTPSPNPIPHSLSKSQSLLNAVNICPLTYKNVTTPIRTSDHDIFSSRSRPVVPLARPPPTMPDWRRFHQCQGDIAKKTLTNPSKPRDARPFKKCSAHVASSSSSKWIGDGPPEGKEVMVS